MSVLFDNDLKSEKVCSLVLFSVVGLSSLCGVGRYKYLWENVFAHGIFMEITLVL